MTLFKKEEHCSIKRHFVISQRCWQFLMEAGPNSSSISFLSNKKSSSNVYFQAHWILQYTQYRKGYIFTWWYTSIFKLPRLTYQITLRLIFKITISYIKRKHKTTGKQSQKTKCSELSPRGHTKAIFTVDTKAQ